MSEAKPAAEQRALLYHIARVYLREARARRARSPAFADTLLQWAANCRRDALALADKPAQMEMF